MTDTVVTLPDGTLIYSDGCTGLPIANEAMQKCCTIHDNGGTDAELQSCWTGESPDIWWIVVIAIMILIMKIFRPVYEWMLKVGILKHRKVETNT